MTETAFLTAVTQFLDGAGLTPAPVSVGIVEPGAAADLPCVVLSLDATERPGSGLGERTTLITGGVLPRQAQIDLADPMLPSEPTFSLLSGDRRTMTLPHGGLVRNDGTRGPLAASDLSVLVGGTPRPLVVGPPVGDEFAVDPDIGQLTFATALPPTGLFVADYFLGQWEQKISRVTGVLRADVCAQAAVDAAGLSEQVVAGLTSPAAAEAVHRIVSISVTELSSVGAPETIGSGGPPGQSSAFRRRTARMRFLFEHVVDAPESSGGIITRIPVTSELDGVSGDEDREVMTVTG